MAKILSVRMTFTEEVLGSAPNNEELMADYIASKAPDAKKKSEEIEAVGAEDVLDRMMTVFPRDEHGRPFVFDYVFKGMLKDSIGFLRTISSSKCSKLKAYKKAVDGRIFISDRRVYFHNSEGSNSIYIDIGDCQRPLRADTPQGPRTALAISETIPAGCYVDVSFILLDDTLLPIVRECLDYGKLHGFGQWRNSGKGKFAWKELECRDATLDEILSGAPASPTKH